MNYISSADDKDENNKIISLLNDLNLNDVIDIKSEGNNNWFEQPLQKRLSQRKEDIKNDINNLTNDILDNIYNKKPNKRKFDYPKDNTSDDVSYNKQKFTKKLRKLDD